MTTRAGDERDTNIEAAEARRGLLDADFPHEPTAFWRASRTVFDVLATLAFDFRAYRPERVPDRGGALILSSHQSYLDPPLLSLRLSRATCYLAKSELFENRAFEWFIRRLNAFPVRQGAGDVGAMKQSIKLIQSGWALAVFPEGSRTFDGSLQPAQKGVGLLVKRCRGVPCVPAVIDGAFEALPRGGSKIPKPHPIRVLYGEPADLSQLKADDVRRWVDDTLARLLDDLRSGRV